MEAGSTWPCGLYILEEEEKRRDLSRVGRWSSDHRPQRQAPPPGAHPQISQQGIEGAGEDGPVRGKLYIYFRAVSVNALIAIN